MTRFFIFLVLASALITLGTFSLFHFQLIRVFPSFYWETIIFLFFSTGLLFRYVFRAPPGEFVRIYLLTMVLKLLGCGAFVFIIIAQDRANAVANALVFMATYFVFTFLEIFFLHRKTRADDRL